MAGGIKRCLRHENIAGVFIREQSVAAAVVGVQVGVHNALHRPAAAGVIDKPVGKRLVLDVAGIDKACLLCAVMKHHLVAREPVALDKTHGGRQHGDYE